MLAHMQDRASMAMFPEAPVADRASELVGIAPSVHVPAALHVPPPAFIVLVAIINLRYSSLSHST